MISPRLGGAVIVSTMEHHIVSFNNYLTTALGLAGSTDLQTPVPLLQRDLSFVNLAFNNSNNDNTLLRGSI